MLYCRPTSGGVLHDPDTVRDLGACSEAIRRAAGHIALGVFLNLVGQYVHFVTSELRQPFAFAVLLAVLLVKPTGLFGQPRVRKV